jgi:hypothetical protein
MQETTPPRRRAGDADSRVTMYRQEVAERAGLYSRLGYPPSRAIARLQANVTWDFELDPRPRPKGLADSDIADIVKATYLRRPAR